LGIYLTGILVAMITSTLLRKFYFKADETPFVMELPPYRIPTVKSSLRHMWGKGEQYLKKMGGVILVASIIVWALNYFPLSSHDESDGQQHDSYLEMMGKAITPVMEPVGFSWRASVAALAGIPAKEIVVSTLGVLYTGDEEATDATLSARITAPNPETGQPDFNKASALAFMIFILLYCPCIATVTAIVKETGSWRYGAFTVVYNTLVAWLVAFAVYRVSLMFL
ncbi:MAG: nucleoside recognition domain-containing protein, partial [Paramuribaculum sp.]